MSQASKTKKIAILSKVRLSMKIMAMKDRPHDDAIAELYRSDPALGSFAATLKAMGMRLAVEPMVPVPPAHA